MISRITTVFRWSQEDKSFGIVITAILCIVTWLLLTPVNPRIAKQTLLRFHLQTKSFAAWACQFPIPSMYNFANQYKIDDYPPGLIMPLFEENIPRHLNHFPTRCFTFADGRGKELLNGENKWVTLDSSYRGQSLHSKFHLQPDSSNRSSGARRSYKLIRLSVEAGSP